MTKRAGAGPAAQSPQLVQDRVQAQARDKLHGIEGDALVLADAEDGYDVGVVQPRRRLGLPLEPPPLVGVAERPRRKEFSATWRPRDNCSAS